MKLYAMTMKFPHASVAQKLFVIKSSMEKSFFSSFILFSESALPRYESYTILAGIPIITSNNLKITLWWITERKPLVYKNKTAVSG